MRFLLTFTSSNRSSKTKNLILKLRYEQTITQRLTMCGSCARYVPCRISTRRTRWPSVQELESCHLQEQTSSENVVVGSDASLVELPTHKPDPSQRQNKHNATYKHRQRERLVSYVLRTGRNQTCQLGLV